MKTWMKVAIGCLALSVMAVFLFVAGVVGFGYWAKGKVEEVTGGGAALEEARQAANAVPFTRPERDIIAEERLVRYIQVRAGIFSVYEKYRNEIEARLATAKERNSLDLGDISTGLTLLGEIRKAEVTALAEHGMSESEYAFITGEVYKSLLIEGHTGAAGKAALANAVAAAERAADDLQDRSGVDTLPTEAREALERARSEIASGSQEVSREIASVRTGPENTALFKKYEADLEKYAMPGLNIFFDPATKPVEPAAPGK